jgi:hypothetical protein
VSHASFSSQQPTLYYKHENYQLSEVKLKHNKRSEAKSFARTVAFSERFRHDLAQGWIAAHVAPSLPRRMVVVVVVVPRSGAGYMLAPPVAAAEWKGRAL